jgi:hypothetical protein
MLVAGSGAVLVGEILDLGFFKRTESFRGPFRPESSETARSFVIALDNHSGAGKLFTSSGDTPTDPYRSNLKLWINGQPAGPAHTIHEEIRKQGAGRYSHWGDALLFSLPADSENGPGTTAVVEYSPRIQTQIYGYGCIAFVLSTAFLLFRTWRLDPDSLRRKAALLARSAGVLSLALFGVAAVATATYFVTIVIGFAQGYSLPNTAVFRLLPWTRALAMYEPAGHYVVALVATAGAVLSWLAPSVFQKDEAALIGYWNRYGLVVIAALFLFTLGATWTGIARPEDLQTSAIGGLVPFIDAHGYFEMTLVQVITGHWQPLAEQRPFAAAHRSLLMFVAGYSNVRFLVLQALAIGCVTYAATRAVMRWRGLWSGMMFFALTLALVRPYLTTHLTEPIGQFWALLAVPFVIGLLRRGALVDGAVSFLATVMSLLTRMGSMFTIPAFAIWLAWTQARDAKRLRLTLLTIAGVLLGCSLVSAALLRIYGSGSGLVGSNFSFVICGATHGGDWTTCQSLYREDLRRAGPDFSATQAHFLYRKAWEGFRGDPSLLFRRLMQGERIFLDNLVTILLGGYIRPIIPRWFPRTAWMVIAACGLVITFWRRRERRELSFWFFMWLGLLASAPFVIFDDGWRVLSSVLPWVALFIACGFASHADVLSPVTYEKDSTAKLSLAGLLLTMSLWMVVPGLAHWLDPLDARAFRTVTPNTGERVVLGSNYMAGFLVIPDDQPVPTDVPSMKRSEFAKAFEYSGNETYQKLTMPPPSIPFAFIAAPSANGTHSTLFLAPAEVLSRRDVRAWRFTLEGQTEEEGGYWLRVAEATPVTPAPR